MRARFRQEAGVAMITVLFVGATMAVLTTSAALMSVKGLRSATQDKSSAQALVAAEAGLERLLLDVARGDVGYGSMQSAGCATPPVTLPPGTLGPGTYDVQLTIYEPGQSPKVPDSPWTANTKNSAPCLVRSTNLFAITATGRQAGGTRVVRQIVSVVVGSTKLPLGIYADRIDANGNPTMKNISVFTAGDVIGRGKFAMVGTDSYFRMRDVYNQSAFPAFTWTGGRTWDSFIPAAVHATGEIYAKTAGTRGREHPPAANCSANDTRNGGLAYQSEWDGSACSGCANAGAITADCGGLGGYPPTARFTSTDLARIAQTRNFTETEYANLRAAAKASGILCEFALSKCTKAGVVGPAQTTWNTADLPTGNASFVAYFEFPYSTNTTANRITWKATWRAISGVMCNPDDPADNRSVVVVVRNGSFDFGGSSALTGAVMVPEGDFDSSGTPVLHGSVTARTFRVRGNATFESSACFAGTLPTMLAEITPLGWSEIDR